MKPDRPVPGAVFFYSLLASIPTNFCSIFINFQPLHRQSSAMLLSYLLSTFRHFRNNMTSGILNLSGLAIGIACAALIFLWVENEFNYNSVVPKKERLYWVKANFSFQGSIRTFDGTPGLLAPAVTAELPGIADACRLGWSARPLFSLGDKSVFEPGFSTDSSFIRMFGLQFIQGRPEDAFTQLHSLVITQKMASHFFGSGDNIIGRSLRMDNNQDYTITGVVRDPPPNTTLKFDWISPLDNFLQSRDWVMQGWKSNAVRTFVELRPGADRAALDRTLHDYIKNKDKDAAGRPLLFAMDDWRLRNSFHDGVQTGGRIVMVRLFAIVAWIILLIACINFMNLATARSEKRAREVGVRKVLGASRNELALQFIGESIAMAIVASALAVTIVAFLLPSFNTLVGEQLSLSLTNPTHLTALGAITLLCGLLAGSYPSVYLSSFKPILVLKRLRGNDRGAMTFAGASPRSFLVRNLPALLGPLAIRKGLVVFQFTVSIALIICTVTVYQQVQHIRDRDLGYDKDRLIDLETTGNLKKNFYPIRQDLLRTGLVAEAGLCSEQSLRTADNTTGFDWPGKDHTKDILISYRSVTPGYFSTMGMQITGGRNFYDNLAADSNDVLITETLERQMGKGSAIGKTISDFRGPFRIIGIVKDYVYGDMYGQPDPVVFFADTAKAKYLYIRYKAGLAPDRALAAIGGVLKEDNPAFPFDYRFVDQEFDNLFRGEKVTSRLSRVFAGLAIIISCLGLFGLSAFTAERRSREIGIRKVLGASTAGITTLLSAEFLKLVFLSALISFPVAWWSLDNWLRNYAYRIRVSPLVFLGAAILAVVIALATVSFQSIRAALANPVKSLRSE
jgi:ABC-type antimicrobial peptide transport system permease subunit